MLDVMFLAALFIQASPPQPDTALLEGEWAIEVIDNIKVMPDAPVTVTFRGTSLTGTASCNTYRGTYSVRGTTLTVNSVLTTMKACDGARMSQERDFLSLLRQIERFELKGDGILRLVTRDDKILTAVQR